MSILSYTHKGTTLTASLTTMAQVREVRDYILMSTDYTRLDDAPLTSQQKTDWATYRQALRDLPQAAGTVESAINIWPSQPA